MRYFGIYHKELYSVDILCENSTSTMPVSRREGWLKNSNMNNNVCGDYDRSTDWIRPLARELAIYSLTDS
jgi:hypothetical protein